MRKTELQISLRNLDHNISVIKSKTTSDIQAVVKANLYGLQLEKIIEILEKGRVCINIFLSKIVLKQ